MQCNFEPHGETDASGMYAKKCRRCGRTTSPTKWPPDKCHATCYAFPLASEIGNWFSLFLEAMYFPKSTANKISRILSGKPCGCGKRAESLNTAGHWIEQKLRALITRKPL